MYFVKKKKRERRRRGGGGGGGGGRRRRKRRRRRRRRIFFEFSGWSMLTGHAHWGVPSCMARTTSRDYMGDVMCGCWEMHRPAMQIHTGQDVGGSIGAAAAGAEQQKRGSKVIEGGQS